MGAHKGRRAARPARLLASADGQARHATKINITKRTLHHHPGSTIKDEMCLLDLGPKLPELPICRSCPWNRRLPSLSLRAVAGSAAIGD